MSSEPQSLQALLDARFREAFGEPQHSPNQDDQWSFRPTSAEGLRINVVMNGTRDGPAVWVFDPNDSQFGVGRTSITQADQIDGLIQHIRDRVDRASHGRDASEPRPSR